jgi:hypothetical protein
MRPVALFPSLVGTECRIPAKAGQAEDPPKRGKPKRPIINCATIIFLPLLPTGEVADDQKKMLR